MRYLHTLQGCFAGGTVLRVAKDLAENSAGARVLVVCSESTVVTFRGPSEKSMASLVGQAIFSDGASSVIIGSGPLEPTESAIFEIMSTVETVLPDSEGSISGELSDVGLKFHLSERVPYLISDSIEGCLVEAFHPLGIRDWNSIFWVPHPGGAKILREIEAKLGLKEDKLRATRQVLAEYGNMSSASVLFILDEIRKTSKAEKMATTGHGLEWGVLFGFGPGITIEMVVLRSIPIA